MLQDTVQAQAGLEYEYQGKKYYLCCGGCLAAFILEQDLHNLTLIGHSFGGLVALVTTLSFEPSQRNRLSRLVLISTVASEQREPAFFRILVTLSWDLWY